MWNRIKSFLIGSTLLFAMVPAVPAKQMDTMKAAIKEQPAAESINLTKATIQPAALAALKQKVLNIPAAAFQDQLANPMEGKHGCAFNGSTFGTYLGSNSTCVATVPLIFPVGTTIDNIRVFYSAYRSGKQGEEIWDQACGLDLFLMKYDLSATIPVGSSLRNALGFHNPNPENNFLEMAGEKMSETGVYWLEARVYKSADDVFCLVTGAQVKYSD